LYSTEIRTKGVGFYRFSKDEEERQEQMRALKQSRLEVSMKYNKQFRKTFIYSG